MSAKTDPQPPLPAPAYAAEVARLAARYRRANGLVMSLVNKLGGQIENRFEMLPDSTKERIDEVVRAALMRSYSLAGRSHAGPMRRDLNERGHLALAAVSGAAGGAGGLASSLAELPLTVIVIFRAIQKIAAEYGFDPETEAVRLECLQVFGAGSPLQDDDGVNSSFLGARLTITGSTLNRIIAAVAPRLGAVLGQKLAAQAVPILGAVTGAGVNYAFMNYYQEMAHVRFGLMKLAETHGRDTMIEAFRAATAPARVTRG